MAKVTPCFENGNIAIMDELASGYGLGSSELFVFRPTTANTKYLFYWLQNLDFIQRACSTMTGTGGLKRVSPQFVRNCEIHIPPLPEQQHIADYLDRQCAAIDAVLDKTRASIEEYKKLKQAVITEAVTKGIRGDRPMRESGIRFIGTIPERWEIRKIKQCCIIVDCKNRTPEPVPDGECTVVRTTCIRDGVFNYEGSYSTDRENFEEWTVKGQPRYGDVFFTREAPMGEACLVPDEDNLCMGQRVMFFRPIDGSDSRYILYSIYGSLAREYIETNGNGSTVGHLKLGQVANLPLLYCKPDEQQEIADYLDKKCSAIDAIIEKKTKFLAELENYKKSLIYEYVTGKKEVLW
jgi:type I restriction enzyme S subunit